MEMMSVSRGMAIFVCCFVTIGSLGVFYIAKPPWPAWTILILALGICWTFILRSKRWRK
jgi:hypothetical protein